MSERLATATTTTGQANYTYDHRGLRSSKIYNGEETRFVYNRQGTLTYESDGEGSQEYIWGTGGPFFTIGTSPDNEIKIHLMGLDHLGTPMRAWDIDSAAMSWAADYEFFGKAKVYLPENTASPTLQIPIRLPGQYVDEETGLHYNGARYYDATTGRFTRPDPMGRRRPGSGGYNYSGNSPGRFIDPSGLAFFMKRPLDMIGSEWLDGLSLNGTLDLLNNEVIHENLFYSDGLSGDGIHRNVGYFEDGGLREDAPPHANGFTPGVSYLQHTKSSEYDDCLMRKAQSKIIDPPPYVLVSAVNQYNCQDYAESLRWEYRKLKFNVSARQECGCN